MQRMFDVWFDFCPHTTLFKKGLCCPNICPFYYGDADDCWWDVAYEDFIRECTEHYTEEG